MSRFRSIRWCGQLGLLLALVSLPIEFRDLAAAPEGSVDGSVLSVTPPTGLYGGPGSGFDLTWTVTNHTDQVVKASLVLTSSRSWPRAWTFRGFDFPPNSSRRFGMAVSIPDTAAPGHVSLISRVRRDDDASTLDSCAGGLLVLDAPPAGNPAVIVSDLVRLEWNTGMRRSSRGNVELQRDGRGWQGVGGIYADDYGRCAFEDRAVTPGSTVEYRMRAVYDGLAMVSAVTTVHVPERTPFAIAGLRPNPSRAAPVVAFTLSERAATRLDVFDLAGRRVWGSDLGELAPGPHVQVIGPGGTLPSGVFVFRLTCGARSVSARGVVAR